MTRTRKKKPVPEPTLDDLIRDYVEKIDTAGIALKEKRDRLAEWRHKALRRDLDFLYGNDSIVLGIEHARDVNLARHALYDFLTRDAE